MSTEHPLPGGVSLGQPAHQERSQGDSIMYDPDKHVLSIVAGRRPTVIFTDLQNGGEFAYNISPADIVSASVQALFSRQHQDQAHAEITLDGSSGGHRDVKITLDPINIDGVMEQLLLSDVVNSGAESGNNPHTVFGKLTENIVKKHTSKAISAEAPIIKKRQGILGFFMQNDQEDETEPDIDAGRTIFNLAGAQAQIARIASENNLTELRNATLRCFWAMLGDRYLSAFDSRTVSADNLGNQWSIMQVEGGIRIRINPTSPERPILIGKNIPARQNVDKLYIEIDGHIELVGVDGNNTNYTSSVASYRAYSIEEVKNHLPLLVSIPQPIVVDVEPRDYEPIVRRGHTWKVQNKELVMSLRRPLGNTEPSDVERQITYIDFVNAKYLAGYYYDDRGVRSEDRRPTLVILGTRGERCNTTVVAQNIERLQINGDMQVHQTGCTLV